LCGKRKGKSNMADAKTEKQKVKEITEAGGRLKGTV